MFFLSSNFSSGPVCFPSAVSNRLIYISLLLIPLTPSTLNAKSLICHGPLEMGQSDTRRVLHHLVVCFLRFGWAVSKQQELS